MLTFKPNAYDKHVYETELRDFLPEKIIDAHVHIWDETCVATANANGGSTWTSLIAEDLTGEDLLNANQLLLPGKEVTPIVFGSCSCDTDIANAMVLKEKKKFGFPAFYRTSYDISAEKLEKDVLEGGYLGLKPYLTYCPPYIPIPEIRIFDFMPHHQLEVANKHGWIVMLHIA